MRNIRVAIFIKKGDRRATGNLVKSHGLVGLSSISGKHGRLKGTRLAKECTKLDPVYERLVAEEGASKSLLEEWHIL